MSNKPKRIVWIDWAKTFFIASVCVGHFSAPETQRLLIYGCHMPAFFFISGFLYKKHDAWRTVISFVVPVAFFFSITFLTHIVKDITQNGFWNYALDFGHPWYRFLGQFFIRIHENPYGDIPVMGSWFIIALMVCRLVSGDIKLFSFVLRYRYVTLVVLLIWLTVEPLIWDYVSIKDVKLYYGIYAMPFFLSGYIVKDLKIQIDNINPLVIIVSAISYCAITLNLKRFDMMNYQYSPTFIVFFVCGLLGCLTILWICTKLPRMKVIEVFSVGTLLILFLHMELDFFIRPVFHRIGLTPCDTYLGQSLLPWLEILLELAIFYYPISWLNTHFPILLGKLKKK